MPKGGHRGKSSPQTVEDRLRRVETRNEISDLVATYAIGADRKNDPEIMRTLFTEDGTWFAEGFPLLQGREAIAEGLAKAAAETVLWSFHCMMPPLIVIDEECKSATCRWYLWECLTWQTNSGAQDQWFGAWYDSKTVLTDEGWKFSSVVLDIRVRGEVSPPWFFKKTDV